MTRIESYGDRLNAGDYQLHSRFRRAVNFACGPSLVALVDRRTGPGPDHLVVSGLDANAVGRVAIAAGELRLDGRPFPLASSRRYDSRIELNGAVAGERFRANLRCFAQALARSAVPRSLAFLLERGTRSRSALERTIAARSREACRRVFSRDCLGGIAMFRGLGFGLTPSGDDFNGGLLLALHCGQGLFQRDLGDAIGSIAGLARGANPFANAMLAHASEGRAGAKVKNLLAALVHGGEKEVRRGTDALRTIGHSSGIDFGVGLLLTLQKLDQGQGETWW
jgi:hypothetical protein